MIALAQREPVYVAVLVNDTTKEAGAIVNAFSNGRVELIPIRPIEFPPAARCRSCNLTGPRHRPEIDRPHRPVAHAATRSAVAAGKPCRTSCSRSRWSRKAARRSAGRPVRSCSRATQRGRCSGRLNSSCCSACVRFPCAMTFCDLLRASPATGSLHDFPIGILADHLPVAERVKSQPGPPFGPSRVVPVSVHFEMPCRPSDPQNAHRCRSGHLAGLQSASPAPPVRSVCPRNENPKAGFPWHLQDAIVKKNAMIRSRSCALKASHSSVSVDPISIASSPRPVVPSSYPPPTKAPNALRSSACVSQPAFANDQVEFMPPRPIDVPAGRTLQVGAAIELSSHDPRQTRADDGGLGCGILSILLLVFASSASAQNPTCRRLQRGQEFRDSCRAGLSWPGRNEDPRPDVSRHTGQPRRLDLPDTAEHPPKPARFRDEGNPCRWRPRIGAAVDTLCRQTFVSDGEIYGRWTAEEF